MCPFDSRKKSIAFDSPILTHGRPHLSIYSHFSAESILSYSTESTQGRSYCLESISYPRYWCSSARWEPAFRIGRSSRWNPPVKVTGWRRESAALAMRGARWRRRRPGKETDGGVGTAAEEELDLEAHGTLEAAAREVSPEMSGGDWEVTSRRRRA